MPILAAMFVTLLSAGQAAALPDFSGSWALVPGTGHPAADITTRANTKIHRDATGTFGTAFTVKMTPQLLTLVRKSKTATVTTIYRFDGVLLANDEGPTQTVSKSTWNGDALTIQTWIATNGRPTGYPLTRVLRLEQGRLVIEERTTGNPVVVSKYSRTKK